MRKRLIAIFAAIALTVGIIAAGAQYYRFVSDTIYNESTSHLTEIYHQANKSLNSMVGRNWGTMRMWVPYLRDTSDEALIDSYIENAQKETGFTDFYFVSREGEYKTIDGQKGYLN